MTNAILGKELSDEITPYPMYQRRRQFLKAAAVGASALSTLGLYRYFNPLMKVDLTTEKIELALSAELTLEQRAERGFVVDEKMTSETDIVSYNNYYEFTTDKSRVAEVSKNFKTDGWQLQVGGLVNKPTTFSMDDLRSLGPVEERIYRMRCVEAWSMVIPWAGIPLSRIIEAVDPMSSAKYVAFETLYDPKQMPGQKSNILQWPYVEGLRMDEAMHPLSILALGLYGRELPPQDGAPVRLVVPWKYGFKGIKSIVKITLVESEPPSSWNLFATTEYGFLSNVNPKVPHPRWSQATEQRIGETGRRPTLMFNGYAEQVASLYDGLDLSVHF
jgi:methionine sulfoxide reductase catalytic subunit